MPGDLNASLRLTADAKGFVGEVRLARDELERLSTAKDKGAAGLATTAGRATVHPGEHRGDGGDLRRLGHRGGGKKLRRAARWWHGQPLDERGADCDALGLPAPPSDPRAGDGFVRGNDFMVLPENWDAVLLFLACATQWRMAASGAIGGGGGVISSAPTGLDYTACRVAARAIGVSWGKEFGRLRVMEAEVLNEQNRNRGR